MSFSALSQLVDLLHECGDRRTLRQVPPGQRKEVCASLAEHFLGHLEFVPNAPAFRTPIRAFTGERLDSAARRSYVMMESIRLLTLLKEDQPEVRKARWAAERMALCGVLVFKERFWKGPKRGMYCCGNCTPAFWRALTAGAFDRLDRDAWEWEGLAALRARRTADGAWRQFPFFYTLLALSEMRSKKATDEKEFAAPACEQFLRTARDVSVFQNRRRQIAELILSKV